MPPILIPNLNLILTTILVIDKNNNGKIKDAKVVVIDKKTKKEYYTSFTNKNGMVSLLIEKLKKDGVSEEIDIRVTHPLYRGSKKMTIKTYKPSTYTFELKPIKAKSDRTSTGTTTDNNTTDGLNTERLPLEDNTTRTDNNVVVTGNTGSTNSGGKGGDEDNKKGKMFLYIGLGVVALGLSIFLLIKATSSKKPPIIESNV